MRRLVLALFCAVLPIGCLITSARASSLPSARHVAATVTKDASVCRHAHGARNRCFAIRVDHLHKGRARHSSTPVGYGPADLQDAYSLPSGSAGRHQTVAIVDAYDDPSAEKDLAVYRSEFDLPACTTSNLAFAK